MVLLQFLSFFIVKDLSYPKLLLLAYCFGGIINHSLMLGMYTSIINTVKLYFIVMLCTKELKYNF